MIMRTIYNFETQQLHSFAPDGQMFSSESPPYHAVPDNRRTYFTRESFSSQNYVQYYDAYAGNIITLGARGIIEAWSIERYIPREFTHLMKSTTVFKINGSMITLYARGQIWMFAKEKLVEVMPVLSENAKGFDHGRELIVVLNTDDYYVYQHKNNIVYYSPTFPYHSSIAETFRYPIAFEFINFTSREFFIVYDKKANRKLVYHNAAWYKIDNETDLTDGYFAVYDNRVGYLNRTEITISRFEAFTEYKFV